MSWSRLQSWARALKRDVVALWLAARDARVPWYAKALAGVVAAYALSPIDLIPDFIPVLGYIDDLILIPVGIAVVVRLIPAEVMEDLRRRAGEVAHHSGSRAAVAVILMIWVFLALALAVMARPIVRGWISSQGDTG